MIRMYAAITFILWALHSSGQNPFFSSVELGGYRYEDDRIIGTNNWPKVFAYPSQSKVVYFDSLRFEGGRHPRDIVRGGKGISLRLRKGLGLKNTDPNRIEWMVGLGYRNYYQESSKGFYYQYVERRDTAKTYFNENVSYALNQQFADLYNGIMYHSYNNPNARFYLSLGLGIQISAPLNVTLKEQYQQRRQYFQPMFGWKDSVLTNSVESLMAKKSWQVQLQVPIGFEIRWHKKLRSLQHITYTLTPGKQQGATRKAEGVIFGVAMRYSF